MKVTFDPIVGLNSVFVAVQQSTSFGELTYTSASSSCIDQPDNTGIKVKPSLSCSCIMFTFAQTISGAGTLNGNFSDTLVQLELGVDYDLCTKVTIFP